MQQFKANIKDARGFIQQTMITAQNQYAAQQLLESMYGKANVSGVRPA